MARKAKIEEKKDLKFKVRYRNRCSLWKTSGLLAGFWSV